MFKRPFEYVLNIISKKEIDLWEIVDEGLHSLNNERVKLLNELGLEYTVHSRFSDINIAALMEDLREAFFKILINSLNNAYRLNSKVFVLHAGFHSPLGYFFPDKELKRNIEFIKRLSRKAEELGVVIAVENCIADSLVKKIEDLERLISEVNSENLKVCLDIGHFFIVEGRRLDRIPRLKKHLVSMHFHDNDGKKDEHLEIGLGKIDWNKVINLLCEINYREYIIIETYSLSSSINSFRKLRSILKNY